MSARRRFPAVTILLLAANLCAAFGLLLYPDLAYQFGFRPDMPRVQTAFTSLFLHANVFHLLGNLVFLAAVGAAVEMATGSIRFASVYFLSGLAGVALHYLVLRHAPDPVPYIGASGCIAGCAAYYSVRYTGLRVPVAPNFSVSVAGVTCVWVFLQVVGAMVKIGESSGVSFWAHLGGFAAGIVISLVFRAPDLGQIRLGHEVLDKMNNRGPVAAAAAARNHLEKHPGDPKALRQLARSCAQTDDKEGEANAILELMGVSPEQEQPALLGRLVEIGQAHRLTTHKRTALAEKYKEGNPSVARALLRSVLKEPENDSQRPEALLALIGLEREREPEGADALLNELLRTYPLHPCSDLARKRGWVA